MGMLRRLVPLLVGAAAGCAATLIAQQYGAEHEHMQGPEVEQDSAAAEARIAAPVTEPLYVRPAVAQPEQPNANPVTAAPAALPRVDGKVDVTRIASPEDFADWDDLGCRS